MIDTVRMQSPEISYSQGVLIEQVCERLEKRSLATGELIWDLTTGHLSGTWDSRVSVRVLWQTVPGPEIHGVLTSSQVATLRIEGSVHKAMLGHNVCGGPVSPVPALRWFVAEISRRLEVPLPDAILWEVSRIDWAECYDLGCFGAVQEYITALHHCQFPKRSVNRYGAYGIMSVGQTTTIKAYHKGPELKAHDLPKLKELVMCGRMDMRDYEEIISRAAPVLRWEVEIKSRKLRGDFDDVLPRVGQLTREYLEAVHYEQVGRLVREGKSEMETVRTNREVLSRLQAVYSKRRAAGLFATWLQFSALGESEVKERMTKPTFYRHRAELEAAGVSWHGSDVVLRIDHSNIPAGFAPSPDSAHRLRDLASGVRFCEASIAA